MNKTITTFFLLLPMCTLLNGADSKQQIAQRSNHNLMAQGALQIAQQTGQKVPGFQPFQHASPQVQQQINNHNANVTLNGGKKR